MGNVKNNDIKQLALACVMFFSFFVKKMLDEGYNNDEDKVSDEDKVFLESYIRYGYISISSALISLFLVVVYYYFPIGIMFWVHSISIFLTIVILIVGAIWAISWTIILEKNIKISKNIDDDFSSLIIYFVPIYNIYMRYSDHDFENPNIWLKESIFWTVLLTFPYMIGFSVFVLFMVFVLWILRMVSLLLWYDVLWKKRHWFIAGLFHVNPEEMWVYVSSLFVFVYQSIDRKIIRLSINEIIEKYKKEYTYILKIDNNIIWEYVIWVILLGLYYYLLFDGYHHWIVWLPFWFIVFRYVIMYVNRKHLPHLPLAYEIWKWILFLKSKFVRKYDK